MTAGNKLSRIIAAFLCAFIAFGIVAFVSPRNEVLASGTVKFKKYDDWGDGCNFNINLSGFKKGAKVTVKLEAPHEIGGYSVWAPSGVEAKKKTDQVLYISFTYNGKNI